MSHRCRNVKEPSTWLPVSLTFQIKSSARSNWGRGFKDHLIKLVRSLVWSECNYGNNKSHHPDSLRSEVDGASRGGASWGQGLQGVWFRTQPCRRGRSPPAWPRCCCCPAQWLTGPSACRGSPGTTRASPSNQTSGSESPEGGQENRPIREQLIKRWNKHDLACSRTWTSGQLLFPSSRASRMLLIDASFSGSSPLMM